LTAALLAACGGNGDPTSVAAEQYAVNSAERNLLISGGSWILNGTGPTGQTFSITMELRPMPDAAFPIGGAVSSLIRENLSLVQAGVTTDMGGATLYFDRGSLAIVGVDNGDGSCAVATANAAPPSTAVVGTSGPLLTRSELNLCASTAGVVGTTTTNWSIESDTGIALLCWNSTARDATASIIETDSSCIQIAPDGSLGTKARLTVTALGVTLAARNF
jgi:hypothetical protein